jgi:hypothetical protein
MLNACYFHDGCGKELIIRNNESVKKQAKKLMPVFLTENLLFDVTPKF